MSLGQGQHSAAAVMSVPQPSAVGVLTEIMALGLVQADSTETPTGRQEGAVATELSYR